MTLVRTDQLPAGERGFDAVLVEARRRGCAVLATYRDGHFVGWEMVPWPG